MFRFSNCLAFSVAAVFGLVVLQDASAQSLFGSGSQGSQTGSSLGGGSTVNRSSTQASGFSSAFGGSGQFGQSSNLNTAGASTQTGMTGPTLNTELGALSATIGQGGFVGGSDTAGRFVGNANTGQQSIQATNVGGANQFGNRGGGFNQQQNQNRNFGSQSRRVIRPQQKIAFDYPQRASTSIQSSLSTQFTRFQSSRPELQGVQVQMGTGQQVVLRGVVQSEDDKKLAAMLARMEPGVRSVQNELTVQSGTN